MALDPAIYLDAGFCHDNRSKILHFFFFKFLSFITFYPYLFNIHSILQVLIHTVACTKFCEQLRIRVSVKQCCGSGSVPDPFEMLDPDPQYYFYVQ